MAKQTVRARLVAMAQRVEATHAWLEQIAYIMQQSEGEEGSSKVLSGMIAMVKVQSTHNMEFCARNGVQLMGGRGFTRGGMGAIVERMYREVRVNAIGGGSEEIMIDLAAKQAKL